jgi:hypothetical protein
MSSLKSDFAELRRRARDGRELGYASFEPIYYLVFPPHEIINVKRQTPAWIASLRIDGWDVQTFSMAEQINDIFKNNPRRNIWIAADRNSPLNWPKTNDSLANALIVNRDLLNRLEQFLEKFAGTKNTLVLVTDLEALHPYLRMRTMESELQGKFHTPTVFLYPGVRTGKTGLKFLGFYKEDGDYRSVHIGG